MSKVSKTDLKELIDQELANARDGKSDDEYQHDDDGVRFLEAKEKISEEEAIIDELLMSVPRSQGYYLKLMKEIRPNEYEFKLRIDNYEAWSDLEYEISNLIRSYTLKQPSKWGSGHYRVIVWRDGGLRGPKHKPIDFFVDAMEQEITGPVNMGGKPMDVESQLQSMSGLIESVKKIMPPPPESLSPADVQKMINEAYLSGIANAEKKSNDSSTVMSTMMTGMFGLMTALMSSQNRPAEVVKTPDPMELLSNMSSMLKNLGLAGNEKKEKSFAENIQELQILGLWKQPKDEDPLSKINEMKSLFDIVNDLGGLSKGERPSIMEKMVDVIGPHVPNMVANITDTVNNAIDYSKVRMGLPGNNQPARRVVKSGTPEALPTVEQPNGESAMSEDPNQQMKMLFNELYAIISSNDYSKFDHIANRLVALLGPAALQDMATGKLPEAMLSNILTMYGDDRYRDQTFLPQLNAYLHEFVGYVKTKFVPQPFIAVCDKCHAEYEYGSEADFTVEPQACDTPNCDGNLVKMESTTGPVDGDINNTIEPHIEPQIDMNPYSTH